MKLGKYSIYFFICFFFNLSQPFSETIPNIKIEDLKNLPSTYEEIEEFIEEDNAGQQILQQVRYKEPQELNSEVITIEIKALNKITAKKNKLVNTVDSPDECNFIVPSIIKQGDLMISISTGGKSPALAKKVRKQLENQFGKAYKDFLSFMGELRQRIIAQFPDTKYRNKIFQALVDSELIDLFKKGLRKKAEKKAEEIINRFSKN